MGALGCKYCTWEEQENMEGKFEQNIKDNNPILLTNNGKNNNDNNIYNINDFISNSYDEKYDNKIKNLNPEINNENDIIQNPPPNQDISRQEINNSKDNIIENIENNNIKQDEEFFIEENKENNNILKSNLEKSMTNQFSINSKTAAKDKVKNYEINKINFGLKKEDKENLNQEQKK